MRGKGGVPLERTLGLIRTSAVQAACAAHGIARRPDEEERAAIEKRRFPAPATVDVAHVDGPGLRGGELAGTVRFQARDLRSDLRTLASIVAQDVRVAELVHGF